MAKFAEALKPNPSNPKGAMGLLTELHLDRNKIGDGGMIAFSDAISKGSMAILVGESCQSPAVGQ
eukprot:5934598-Prymnesium_polylepis.2